MPIAKVQLEDGRIARFEVPDGTTQEQVLQFASQMDQSPAAPASPTDAGMPAWLQNMAAEGHADPTTGMSALGKGWAAFGGVAPNLLQGIGQRVGLVDQSAVDESKKLRAPLLNTTAGKVGDFAGNVALALPTAAIPGANTALGASAIGAGLGLMQPTATGESAITNAAMGAAGGLAGNAIGRGIARVVAPRTQPAAKELLDAGASLTPGQILGPVAKRVEDGLTSVPILGDAIKAGQRGAVEDFNRVIAGKVLAPIGQKIPMNVKAGHDMVKYVGDALSDSYDTVLPSLSAVADGPFVADLSKLTGMAQNMADGGKQFTNILNRELYGKMAPNGGLAGETIKEIESNIGRMSRDFMSSSDGNQRMLGAALHEAQTALRGLVERSNPDVSELLRNINTGWAMLTRLENAAGRAGSKEGVFSPAAFRAATKAMDKSARKRAASRGTALMQKFAEDAESVLGSTVPDSGTPYRLMAAAGLPAIMGAPGLATAAMGGATAYGTDIGRRAMAALLAKRPAGAQAISDAIRGYLVPAAPAIANPLMPFAQQ